MEKHQRKDFFGPPNDNPFFALARDPLSSLARKHRKTLVLVATISLAVSFAGMVPRQFTTFGVALSAGDQKVLIFVAWLSVLYFLVSFCSYALNDYWAWEANLTHAILRFVDSMEGKVDVREAVELTIDDQQETMAMRLLRMKVQPVRFKLLALAFAKREITTFQFSKAVSWTIPARMSLDFVLPVLLGLFALIALLFLKIDPTVACVVKLNLPM